MTKPPITPLRDDQRIEPRTSDAHCELIGEAVATWTTVDDHLEMLIWDFLAINEDNGRIVTARLDTVNKIKMVRSLVRLHIAGDTEAKRIGLLLNKIDRLRLERNFIIHGRWGTLIPENVPIAASLRIDSDVDEVVCQAFPASRMKRIIQHSNFVMTELSRLILQLPSLRRKLS